MSYLKTFAFVLITTLSMPLYAVDDAVNINSADAREIEKELTGVTETIAKRIVEYREANGPYMTKEDLLKIEGVEYDIININRNSINVEVYGEDDA
ncbi:MAG: helix-hairpin-helix domain-containing protein [Gammaproteobacteria bacterium]